MPFCDTTTVIDKYKSMIHGWTYGRTEVPGVNILQKAEDFVFGIIGMLQGINPEFWFKNFDNLKKNN